MNTYNVGTGPLTGDIYAGKLDKVGRTWASRSVVTEQAIIAVADHVQQVFDGEMTASFDGARGERIQVEITVRKVGE